MAARATVGLGPEDLPADAGGGILGMGAGALVGTALGFGLGMVASQMFDAGLMPGRRADFEMIRQPSDVVGLLFLALAGR